MRAAALATPWAAAPCAWLALAAAAYGYGLAAVAAAAVALWLGGREQNALRRNQVILVFLVGIACCPSLLTPHPPQDTAIAAFDSWLGSDAIGRDYWSRLIHGYRQSSTIAFAAALLATLNGLVVAVLLVFSPAPIARLTRFLVELFLSLPILLLLLPAVVYLPGGRSSMILVLGCLLWPETARLAEQKLEALAVAPFVTAARMRGDSAWPLFVGELWPHLQKLLATCLLLNALNAVLLESILSFLGLGLPLGTPSLGGILEEAARKMERSPALLAVTVSLLLLELMVFRNLSKQVMAAPHRSTQVLIQETS